MSRQKHGKRSYFQSSGEAEPLAHQSGEPSNVRLAQETVIKKVAHTRACAMQSYGTHGKRTFSKILKTLVFDRFELRANLSCCFTCFLHRLLRKEPRQGLSRVPHWTRREVWGGRTPVPQGGSCWTPPGYLFPHPLGGPPLDSVESAAGRLGVRAALCSLAESRERIKRDPQPASHGSHPGNWETWSQLLPDEVPRGLTSSPCGTS